MNENDKQAEPVQPVEPVDLRELFERLLFGTYAGKDSYYNDEQIKHGCFERAQELVDVAKRMNIALYTEAPAVAQPPAEVVRELVEVLKQWKHAEKFESNLGRERTDAEENKLYELWNKAEELREAALAKAKEHGL